MYRGHAQSDFALNAGREKETEKEDKGGTYWVAGTCRGLWAASARGTGDDGRTHLKDQKKP